MNKVKCPKGHFFDADKFFNCPVCAARSGGSFGDNIRPKYKEEDKRPQEEKRWLTDEKTVTEELAAKVEDSPEDDTELTLKLKAEDLFTGDDPTVKGDPVKDERSFGSSPSSLATAIANTSSMKISALPKTVAFYDFEEITPPAGWIVCTKGKYQGQAFECKAGKNRIGRGDSSDIVLTDELSVSRDVHALIIYEPGRRQFFIQAGSGKGLTYLNGSLVFSHEELHAYDNLRIGNSEFVFIPLCGERFSWNDYIKTNRD